jgi:hypothetical protein
MAVLGQSRGGQDARPQLRVLVHDHAYHRVPLGRIRQMTYDVRGDVRGVESGGRRSQGGAADDDELRAQGPSKPVRLGVG